MLAGRGEGTATGEVFNATTGGFGLHYGLQKLGCMMIPAGSGNTERHIAMIEDYGTTVLVATPSYALHV